MCLFIHKTVFVRVIPACLRHARITWSTFELSRQLVPCLRPYTFDPPSWIRLTGSVAFPPSWTRLTGSAAAVSPHCISTRSVISFLLSLVQSFLQMIPLYGTLTCMPRGNAISSISMKNNIQGIYRIRKYWTLGMDIGHIFKGLKPPSFPGYLTWCYATPSWIIYLSHISLPHFDITWYCCDPHH